MKTIKTIKTCCALIGAAALLTASPTFANLTGTVTLCNAGGNANQGGWFQAVTSDNGTFYTFCLSIPTAFNLGHSYYYDISSTIVANGVGAPPAAPDYVTFGTAYLYSQFLAGNAAYSNINAVQATIWYLQGNLTKNGNGTGGIGFYDPENHQNLFNLVNPILVSLEGYVDLSQLMANGNGAFNVSVMNLYSDPDGSKFAQPQLYSPVPEPSTIVAGALLLLPFGVSTLRIMRKNKVQ